MKKRRAIGIILTAVAMAFAMVPLTGNNKAFAQGDDVATIGDNGYASLAAAVQAAGTNKTTIKLVKDTVEGVVIPANADITIDLNGHTIKNAPDTSNAEGKPHTFENYGKLTLLSGNGEGVIDNITHAKACVMNQPGGEVVISGKLLLSRSNLPLASGVTRGSWYNICNMGEMTINDGVRVINNDNKHTTVTTGFLDTANIPTAGYEAKLTVNGGYFEGKLNAFKVDSAGELIFNDGEAVNESGNVIISWHKMTINGGTIRGATPLNLSKYNTENEKGITVINGGTFTCGENRTIFTRNNNSVGGAELTINGGTFNGSFDSIHQMRKNGSGEMYIKCTIKGGKYDRDVLTPYEDNATIPEGKVLQKDADGYYSLHGPFYTVNVTADPAEGGTVKGGGTVEEGESTTVKAAANTGYGFNGWYDGNTSVSGSEEYTISSVTGDMNLTAKFVKIWNANLDMNGGTIGGKAKTTWELIDGDDNWSAPTIAEMDRYIQEGMITAPANSEYIGLEITDKNGTKTYQPGNPYTVVSDVTLKVLWQSTLPNTYIITAGANGQWTKDSGKSYELTVKRSEADDTCFSHFTGVEIDGVALTNGTDYTAVSGSTVITLKASALQKLAAGNHTVTVNFDDGKVSTGLTVKANTSTFPKTGDGNNIVLWLTLMIISLIGFGAAAFYRRRKPE